MVGITVVLFIIWGILSTLLDGWVLKTLWNWFMVTTFGLVQLKIATAIGMSLVIRYLTGAYEQDIPFDNILEIWGKAASKQIGIVIVVMVIGFIVKSCM